MQSPRLYSAFLLWLMSELWEELPEVGDLDKPKLVFFFDEAHLLFRDAPKELINKVEQVVRLIRSKGVGIYFVTQSPADIPEIVLSQLGNRFQHALRAYTPTDQKAVRAAAQAFRANANVDVAKEIQELGVGEALVSTLDEKGAPTPVARTKVRPPNSPRRADPAGRAPSADAREHGRTRLRKGHRPRKRARNPRPPRRESLLKPRRVKKSVSARDKEAARTSRAPAQHKRRPRAQHAVKLAHDADRAPRRPRRQRRVQHDRARIDARHSRHADQKTEEIT